MLKTTRKLKFKETLYREHPAINFGSPLKEFCGLLKIVALLNSLGYELTLQL